LATYSEIAKDETGGNLLEAEAPPTTEHLSLERLEQRLSGVGLQALTFRVVQRAFGDLRRVLATQHLHLKLSIQ